MKKEIIENLEGEIWIENNGYKISNKGRIIGKRGRLLTCKENWCGYLRCDVKFDDGFHAKSVHRAVAYAFIPNDDPKNKIEVNHKDGVKTNNCVENLEWVTKKENQEHEVKVLQQRSGENNYMNKLTDEQVIEIHGLCKEGEITYKEIAVMYKMSPSVISSIAQAIRWRHLGLEPIKIKQGSHGKGRSGGKSHKNIN